MCAQINAPARTLLLAASLGLLAGCGAAVHHGHHDPTLLEVEPNGSAASANPIGPLRPGVQYAIRGHVTDLGPDFFDGFAFFSETPLTLEFVLTADNPAADLDLCVFDPFIGDFVACFENPWNPETGFVDVYDPGVDFHLVVSSFAGVSSYTLDVLAHPLGLAAAASAQAARIAPAAEARAETRRAEFWRAYAAQPEPIARASAAERLALPGLLILIDLDTGEIARRRTARIGDRILIE